MNLYEILVPTIRMKDGKPYRTRFHRVWDEKVRKIAGGLTILTPTKGQWVSVEGTLFVERMIPVRIACDEDKIEEIIEMTIKYYEQEAVMCYKISNEVMIRYAPTQKDCDECEGYGLTSRGQCRECRGTGVIRFKAEVVN